jgi:hypothetical protein
VSAPEPVGVKAWGELPGEMNLPGALHVLVAGQSVGGAERVCGVCGHRPHGPLECPDCCEGYCEGKARAWRACWYTAQFRDRCTGHPTAEEAVAAVIASGWARKLGARKASRVYWSEKAKRRAGGAR